MHTCVYVYVHMMKYHLYAPAAAVGGIRAVSPSLSLPTYL